MTIVDYAKKLTHEEVLERFLDIRAQLELAHQRNTILNKENDKLRDLVISLESLALKSDNDIFKSLKG